MDTVSFCCVVSPKKVYWTYQYHVDGKVREMSLGAYPAMGLAEARIKHAGHRARVIAHRADPLLERQQGRTDLVPTFGEAADAYLAAHEQSWKGAKHRDG